MKDHDTSSRYTTLLTIGATRSCVVNFLTYPAKQIMPRHPQEYCRRGGSISTAIPDPLSDLIASDAIVQIATASIDPALSTPYPPTRRDSRLFGGTFCAKKFWGIFRKQPADVACWLLKMGAGDEIADSISGN